MNIRALVTLILSALVLATFLSLGFWQLRRLEWKQGVLADIDARISAAPVAVPAEPEPERDRYLPVTETGYVSPMPLRVLVSHRDHGPGYRLVTKFQTPSGAYLLDLGFIRTSAALPVFPNGPLTVTGNLHWPDDRNSATPENDLAANIWYARDLDQMAAALETSAILIVARDLPAPMPGLTPLPVTSEGVRNDHLEYALTWFLLAATWVVMTAYALWRIRRRQHQG